MIDNAVLWLKCYMENRELLTVCVAFSRSVHGIKGPRLCSGIDAHQLHQIIPKTCH